MSRIPGFADCHGIRLETQISTADVQVATLPQTMLACVGNTIDVIGFHKKAELAKNTMDVDFIGLGRRLHAAGVRPTPLKQDEVVDGIPLAEMAFCMTERSTRGCPNIVR
jgi:hypothetical protein